ncbi:MAG: hypothetical protein JKY46_08810 [Robiginitomaculum sp.]|nr:hypothetical protein [Robiginitomaculum sp.]
MDKNDDKKLERARLRKKRKALSRLRKALLKSKDLPQDNEFTEWENEFANGLEERLETFGSAFVDPDKGKPDEALSYLQAIKLKEIEDKAKGKNPKIWNRGGGFGKKKPAGKKYGVRSFIADDDTTEEPPEAISPPPPKPKAMKPKLTIIKGGKE